MQHQNTCIVIAGPTAVGKTAAAIKVAQAFGTKIISADSRQCYRELNIGVAKPSQEELAAVHHYFINSHSIVQQINAVAFEQYALEAAAKIFKENNFAVMVGGTGMYIKAFCEGMDAIPQVPFAIRNAIVSNFESMGLPWLQAAVMHEDPLYFATAEKNNPQRLMRALEVKRATGNSIKNYQVKQKAQRPFNTVIIGLELPRAQLYERINERVEVMMQNGLAEEVKQLLPNRYLNALQTVGYTELFEYFDESITLHRAVELIKQNSRHYAKRQLTWFKRQLPAMWIEAGSDEKIYTIIKKLKEEI
jgi:tRNA dimethylallyltransferase